MRLRSGFSRAATPSTRAAVPGDDREWHTELPGGLVRVDIGEPVKRLEVEPRAELQKGASGLGRKVEATPEAPLAAPAVPVEMPRRAPRPEPRPWGLGKNL